MVGQGKRGVLGGGWPAAALKAKIAATGQTTGSVEGKIGTVKESARA